MQQCTLHRPMERWQKDRKMAKAKTRNIIKFYGVPECCRYVNSSRKKHLKRTYYNLGQRDLLQCKNIEAMNKIEGETFKEIHHIIVVSHLQDKVPKSKSKCTKRCGGMFKAYKKGKLKIDSLLFLL